MTERLYYLASPYAHRDPAMMITRYKAAIDAVAELMLNDLVVFSPIVHNHHVNVSLHKVDESQGSRWDYWKRFDLAMLDRCDAVIVLMIDGWRESVGVAAEVKHAEEQGKPVYYYDRLRPIGFMQQKAKASV